MTLLRVEPEEEERVGAELLDHFDLHLDLRQVARREGGVLERLGPDADDHVAVGRGRAAARGRAGS